MTNTKWQAHRAEIYTPTPEDIALCDPKESLWGPPLSTREMIENCEQSKEYQLKSLQPQAATRTARLQEFFKACPMETWGGSAWEHHLMDELPVLLGREDELTTQDLMEACDRGYERHMLNGELDKARLCKNHRAFWEAYPFEKMSAHWYSDPAWMERLHNFLDRA